MGNRAGPDATLVMERIFDAPVAAVWKLWTDPEQVAAWYGPDGASIPVADLDVRVGGLRHPMALGVKLRWRCDVVPRRWFRRSGCGF